MNESEFDRFAEEYHALHAQNIRSSGEAPEFFAEYKVRDVSRRARMLGVEVRTLLDFGSGVGNSIPFFRRCMPNSTLVCADVSKKSLEIAQRRFPNLAHYHHIRGDALGLESERFDLLFSACVFHHIPHNQHQYWLEELRSVAEPGALLAIFEHNPWNPLTAHAVATCSFDVNAALIPAHRLKRFVTMAGWHDAEVNFRMFFPRQLAWLRGGERWLNWLPFGAQYVVFARA